MMSRRFLSIAGGLCAFATLGAALAAQQPRLINGQLAAQPAGSALVETVRSLVAQEADVAWIGYAVPVRDGNQTMCCWSKTRTHANGRRWRRS